VSEQPAEAPPQPRRGVVVAVLLLVGAVLDLFCLLLLPWRVSGHLVPVAPVLVFVVNAVLASVGSRLARDRLPARVLLALAVALSAVAAVRGPGGDVLVTRDLQGMYLLFVLGALLGAAVPLLRRGLHPDG
jgi:uncharacterized membrane protein YoaK (UPF0700 family)